GQPGQPRQPGQLGQVVHAEDVQMGVLMMELCNLVEDKGVQLVGPVMRLAALDATAGSDLVSTLEAWLDSFVDVNATAEAVHVHPNTVRYRLRRMSEVGELDLQCPEARYEAMLQIRLLRARESHAPA
ncbi:MAG: helix-turn-helix domain-containing protein, partial [Nocardioides sp.]